MPDLSDFTPATGGGRFDVELSGDKIKVIHKFALINHASKPVSAEEYQAFGDKFLTAVRTHWEGKFGFQRGGTTYRPRFKMEFLDDEAHATAHYVINLLEGQGGNELVSRKTAFIFQDLAKGGHYAPLTSNLFSGSVNPTDSSSLIADDLGRIFPLYLDTYNGALTSYTQTQCKRLMSQVAEVKPNLKIEVTSYGLSGTTAQTAVVNLLRGVGLTRVKKRKSSKAFIPKYWFAASRSRSSGRQHYVKVAIEGAVDAALLKSSHYFTYPSACVHEYGHMLGLQDEYACLSKQGAQKLVDLDFIEASEQARYEQFHTPGARDEKDGPDVGQAAFFDLCERAGVDPPHFGRQTNSIMSSGSVFLPCHFVTLWEALEQIKGQSDWKIVSLT
ncbi:MAG: hypothetical protein L0Z62_23195 [Gemmataceae bacterium]|nr:hypothetical protein [Gemmataceae bacterium]